MSPLLEADEMMLPRVASVTIKRGAPSLASISRVCQIPLRIKTRATALTNLLVRSKVVPLIGDVVVTTAN
jgi:hypothetical protein